MKKRKVSRLYVLETISDDSSTMYILRNNQGMYQFATSSSKEFLDYLKNPDDNEFDPHED